MPSISVPALVAAGVGAAGSIAGAVIGGNAATSAAKTQADAANQAAQIQQKEFNTTTANEAPYLAAGNNSLAALMQSLGLGPGGGGVGTGVLNKPFNPTNLQNTPGYQWQFGQGEQALLNAKTATGGVGGGNTLQALVGYGQGMASTEYQQALQNYMAQQQQSFGQLQTLAGSGQNAAAQLGSLGNQSAATIGNDLTSGAAATAAGQVGSANAINNGISGVSSNFLLASLLNGSGGFGGAASQPIGGSQTYDTTGIQTVG